MEESLWLLRQDRAICAVRDMQKKSVDQGLDKASLEEINVEIEDMRKK